MATRRPTKVSGEYASGIAFPVRGDGDGGFRLAEGDEYIRGLINSAVRPNYSDNPFQDIGGTHEPMFQNAGDIGWRQVYKRRIRRVFEDLDRANLAKLVSMKFTDADGEVTLHLRYLNKENATESDVAVPVQGPPGAGTATQIPGWVG